MFTTQGWVSARTAEQYKQFWLNKDDIINGLSIEGYYYKNYPHYTEEYGMTWFAECYVRKIVEEADLSLKFVSYSSAELDKHQDVFVFQKRANTLSG